MFYIGFIHRSRSSLFIAMRGPKRELAPLDHIMNQSCRLHLRKIKTCWKFFTLILISLFGTSCSYKSTPNLSPTVVSVIAATSFTSSPTKTPIPTLITKTSTVKPSVNPQTPVATVLPPPSSTKALTKEQPIAQIGAFRSIYLHYDPAEWETFDEFHTTNPSGERTESLRHKFIAGCILHENFGRGAPQSWRREDTNRQIGDLVFRVEMWTDMTTHKTPLVVYSYQVNEMNIRIELVVSEKPKLCIENAESIIAQSSYLIVNQMGVVASPASVCNIGPQSVWNAPSIAIGYVQDCLLNSGSRECLLNLMKKYDASPDAITFVSVYSKDGFLTMFQETGTVDLGTFVFSYPLVDGCHACANVGKAQVAFDFDSQGKFIGKSLQ